MKQSMIKPMNCSEFAEYLMKIQPNDTIEFACSCECDFPREVPNSTDCTDWYFARIITIPEYMSRFILIDYCGGEEAFAIPLNNYSSGVDDDDECIIKSMTKQFFLVCRGIESLDAVVFVEIKS